MTLDPDYLERMHREVDGLNSPEESASLREYLAGNPTARSEFDRLERLSETLARVDTIEPPREMRQAILDSVRSMPAGRESGLLARFRALWPEGRVALRYGYAVAAGILIGMVLLHWSAPGSDPAVGVLEPSEMVGAMTGVRPAEDGSEIHRSELDWGGTVGTARLLRAAGAWMIDVELESSDAVTVTLSFDDANVDFLGFGQASGGPERLEFDAGGVTWSQRGHQQTAVFLVNRSDAPTSVELRLVDSEGMGQGHTFEIPALN